MPNPRPSREASREAQRSRSPKDTFITVYGRMPVLEVLMDETLDIDKLVIADNAHGDSLNQILSLAQRRGVPVKEASAQRVKLLAGNGKQDQGIIADVIAPRLATLAEFADWAAQSADCRSLVLDGVNNPANVGMIIRTATAAGIDAIVLPRYGSPGINPLVIKASAGVAYRAAVVRAATGAEAVAELRDAGCRVYGLSADGRSGLYEAKIARKAVFVLGNETEGMSRETEDLIDTWLSIPMAGGVDSLNVASAAAVLCFELVRRDTLERSRLRKSAR
jgi:23S rRNA (guanosine2251-2'-O)-methyltransferase